MDTRNDGRLMPRPWLLVAMAAASVALCGFLLIERVRAASGDACDLVVSPSVVEVGQSFWVSGNFNNAAIYQVRGENVAPTEDSQAVAFAAPNKASFRFRFEAERGEVGVWTIWAIAVDTECSDSAVVKIVRDLPDTATRPAANAPVPAGLILIALALVLLWDRRRGHRGSLPQ
jgi:hypothetical protein